MSKMNEIFKKNYKIGLVVFLAIFLLIIFYELQNLAPNRQLSEHYISKGVQETGAINLVASVLYDYRSFDTLGEATVILTTTATLSFLIPAIKVAKKPVTKFTVIVQQTVRLILPFLAILGMQLIFFGHLSPGGGFVGGVVLAIIPILLTISYSTTFSEHKFKPAHKALLEDIGAIGFILLGLLSILAGNNFLANGQADFKLGTPGKLISGGLIPYLNLMIGIKVGAGLAIIFNSLTKED
jgi:multicomponent Na+:H+ antiporter subunit B